MPSFFNVSGCTALIDVNVDTSTDPSLPLLPNSKIFISENLDANDPLFDKEVLFKIKRLLESMHFEPTSNISDLNNVDYYLFFNYGIGEKEKQGHGLGYKIDQTTSVSSDVKLTTPGYFYTYDTKSKANESWIRVKVIDKTLYKNWADEYEELKKNGTPEEQLPKAPRNWEGIASGISRSPILRLEINYLIIGLFDYFGKNTGKIEEIGIEKNDPRLQSLNMK